MTALFIGLGVMALVIAVALASRSGRPRVRTIERKTVREKDEDDDA